MSLLTARLRTNLGEAPSVIIRSPPSKFGCGVTFEDDEAGKVLDLAA